MEEDIKKFEALKEEVVENLILLEEKEIDCREGGLVDPGETLYNRIVSLIDDADAIDNYEELKELILRGKEIEKTLEIWLASQGINSLELSWPTLPA